MGYQLEVGLKAPKEEDVLKRLEMLTKTTSVDVTMKDLESVMKEAGRSEWTYKVAKGESGAMIYGTIMNAGAVSRRDLAWWLAVEDRVNGLDEFLAGQFPSRVCHEVNGVKVRYEVPSNQHSLGDVFDLVENKKTELNVEDYSISQASLDQIFNQFAAKQYKK